MIKESILEYCNKNNKELLKEWNFSRNIKEPKDYGKSSAKKVYWICEKGHSWEARIADRVRGNGCPYCAGKIPIVGINDLATMYPKLAKEWNYNKNVKLPSEFMAGSGKKVWWKCSEDHEWEATIDSRVRGNGCPYCAGQIVITGKNDLKTLYPRIAEDWDYELNYPLLPTQIMAGSGKKVWWKCKNGHSWQVSPNNRTSQYSNCPVCSSECGTSFPEQAIFYYVKQLLPAINRYNNDGTEIDIFIPAIKLGIEYDGIYYHCSKASTEREYKKDIFCKENGIRLIRIKENRANREKELDVFYRKIGKNSTSLEDAINLVIGIIATYGINIDEINVNLQKDDLEIYNNYISMEKENSIVMHNPELLKEWDYGKNHNIDPTTISYGSNIKVWWLCELGHSYKATVSHRTGKKATSCPICAGQQILSGYNDLASKRPDLLEEWDYGKNMWIDPHLIGPNYSTKKVWWKCEKGHTYEATPHKRNSGRNCPYCAGRKVWIGYNDLESQYPEIVKDWDYELNDNLKPTDVVCGSNKVVYWKCHKCGFQWKLSVIKNIKRKKKCKNCGV